MKKILIAAALIIVAQSASAQMFIGGSVDFSTTSNKYEGTKTGSTTTFGIMPELGYSLNDKFDVGINLGIGTSNVKNDIANTEVKSTDWTVAPFVRYSLVQFGDFKVMAKGSVYYAGSTSEPTDVLKNESTSFGVSIKPILAYNLSEKFTLLANLNFMAVAFNYTEDKATTAGVSTKDKTTSFGLMGDTDNVLSTGGNGVTVGFAYNF